MSDPATYRTRLTARVLLAAHAKRTRAAGDRSLPPEKRQPPPSSAQKPT